MPHWGHRFRDISLPKQEKQNDPKSNRSKRDFRLPAGFLIEFSCRNWAESIRNLSPSLTSFNSLASCCAKQAGHVGMVVAWFGKDAWECLGVLCKEFLTSSMFFSSSHPSLSFPADGKWRLRGGESERLLDWLENCYGAWKWRSHAHSSRSVAKAGTTSPNFIPLGVLGPRFWIHSIS